MTGLADAMRLLRPARCWVTESSGVYLFSHSLSVVGGTECAPLALGEWSAALKSYRPAGSGDPIPCPDLSAAVGLTLRLATAARFAALRPHGPADRLPATARGLRSRPDPKLPAWVQRGKTHRGKLRR